VDWKIILLPSCEKYASAFCPPKVSCFKSFRRVSLGSPGCGVSGFWALTVNELLPISNHTTTSEGDRNFMFRSILKARPTLLKKSVEVIRYDQWR